MISGGYFGPCGKDNMTEDFGIEIEFPTRFGSRQDAGREMADLSHHDTSLRREVMRNLERVSPSHEWHLNFKETGVGHLAASKSA